MATSHRWKLIQRYITGSCTERERKEIKHWMEEDPANRQLVHEVSNIWELSSEEEFEVNVEEAWDGFREREIKDSATAMKRGRNRSGAKRRMVPVFRAAAAILLAAFIGWFSWQYLDSENTAKVASVSEAVQTLETGNGERAQLTFSDGTVVILNAASTLEYPKAFNRAQRKVKLRGEAYFEVAPNKDKPFVVDAGMAKVEVLGTKFNVSTWDEIGVGVREGKVAVNAENSASSKKERVLLAKGEFASLTKGEGLSEVQSVNVENHMLWLNGGIYFDKAPFSKVVKKLERNFNVQVEVTDKQILQVPFTGTFQNAKLGEVLDVISASMGVNYTRTDSLITF